MKKGKIIRMTVSLCLERRTPRLVRVKSHKREIGGKTVKVRSHYRSVVGR